MGMDMKTYLRQATPDQRQALAAAVHSSVGYFYLIAGNHKRPSAKLCHALVAAEPKLNLHELRPDIWPEAMRFNVSSPADSAQVNEEKKVVA